MIRGLVCAMVALSLMVGNATGADGSKQTSNEKKPYFLNPIAGAAGARHTDWQGGGNAGYEQARDGQWALYLDSTPSPGRNWDIWESHMMNIFPNTDYRISFDRMYDAIPDQKGVARFQIFGRRSPVPNSDQPRIWDRFTIQMNSGEYSGKVPFDILHYNDNKKVWYRNFQIEVIEVNAQYPLNGETVDTLNPVLRWEGTPDASYAVQVSNSPDFSPDSTTTIAPILDKDHLHLETTLQAGTWYWRIAVASAALVDPRTAQYGSPQAFVVAAGAEAAASEVKSVDPIQGPRQITISDSGQILADGEPQFLIGLYAVMEERSELEDDSYMTDANVAKCEPLFQELVDAGFNTIHNYGTASGRDKQVNAYLDLADKYGLWVLVDLTGVQGLHVDVVQQQIRSYGHHPSVLSWLLVDEGDMKGWSPVKARYMADAMRAVDPSRPIGMVVRDCVSYANAVDLLLPDPYTLRSVPTPQFGLMEMLTISQAASVDTITPTSVVSLLQAFKYEDEFDKENKASGRVPSYEEERCISYLSIAAGQQGVLFYAYHSSATYLKSYPDHWENMKKIASELRDRSPIFLAPAADRVAQLSDKEIVHFSREYDGDHYLFVINPDAKLRNVSIQFDASVQKIYLMEEEREVSVRSRYMAQMPPFAVQTFRLTISDKKDDVR